MESDSRHLRTRTYQKSSGHIDYVCSLEGPEFIFRDENLEPVSLACYPGFCDRDTGKSKQFADDVQAQACSLNITWLKCQLFLIVRYTKAVIFVDDDKGSGSVFSRNHDPVQVRTPMEEGIF